ncbi:hypothetical protein [uncultured Vibrio sp.]|uniref:hypothetical protein n=1 Tax=uncultured Vibrio sp. TaxID=114054 RepID=UPI002AA6254C|nr:hypothetical protein [uncultured Vibrio sp.]
MTQNIEQRTEAAVTKYEKASVTIEKFAETDGMIQTGSGSRNSFPKLSREIKEEAAAQLASQNQQFQDRFNTLSPKPWVPNDEVTNSLQVYTHTDGNGVERTYLPNPDLVVPDGFITGATFAEDLAAGRFEENSVVTSGFLSSNYFSKILKWIDEGDIRGWGAVLDGNPELNTGTDNTEAVQGCINSSGQNGHPVLISGIAKCYGTLTWKQYTKPYASSDKGQYLMGNGASSCILLGDDHDLIDLAGAQINIKKLQIAGYGQSKKDELGKALEFSGRIIFDSSRPGNAFVSTEDAILSRCGVAVDGEVGTYNNKYYRTKFDFCKVGVEGERAYGSTFESCHFICQTAVRALDTTVHAVSFKDCHFALGTYGEIFDTWEITLDLLCEGVTFGGRNYGETYASVPHDSTFLRMGLNSTDTSIVEGLYLNLNQASEKWTPRELYVQAGYSNIKTKSVFKNNRVNAPDSTVQKWFTTSGNYTITMKEDEIPSHSDNILIPDEYKGYTNESYKAVFVSSVSVTDSMNFDFTTMQSSETAKVSDNRIVNASGNLNLRTGSYKVTVGGRATLPQEAVITLEFSGALKFNVVIGEDGYLGGSAMLSYTSANSDVVVTIKTGLGTVIDFYGLTIFIEKIS